MPEPVVDPEPAALPPVLAAPERQAVGLARAVHRAQVQEAGARNRRETGNGLSKNRGCRLLLKLVPRTAPRLQLTS